jgi:c-di-GMP-binding flagellar brake protein YcgR
MKHANDPAAPPSAGESYYDKCMVHGAAEIRRHLQKLVDARCTMVGHAEGNNASVVTVLIAVEEASLLVDVPRSRERLDAWLASSRLLFEGTLDRIAMRFGCGPGTLDTHAGRPALRLPMPTRLLYLQRREFMRREPPAQGLRCHVPASANAGHQALVEATIRDIGGGGLAMLAPHEAVTFTIGDVLADCVIELPDFGKVMVNLRVRHVVARKQRGKDAWQAGCEFVDLPAGTQDKLFRYVMQLERERVSRQRALARD